MPNAECRMPNAELTFEIEIVLRERDDAVAETLSHPSAPREWTVDDVREILKKMLAAIDRAKNPDAPVRDVTLRGFSWIVEPFDSAQGKPSDGRVVIALEIPMGAAVAGPFDIDEPRLTSLIAQAVRSRSATSVH
jgi:hypothetical protein